MVLNLNGDKVVLDSNISLLELLQQKGINPETVVVEYNYNIVKREEWPKIILKENDNLEVIRFVGGG
ncbi:sulfur carrier protein ThiS [Thermoanaerobacterium sp. RBIITD]|uniref:sulfur carrier protein ThiS n=1 Tax=Thermoanaerobacterium sp. RBIITD TaxID=1550240 RepID=UPI000BB6C86F|nr:sulfur carrier protein ThiS [Thermoanaerobacterium sp. RBIITD]SNX54878.1 sulfur carrier protein [Thermoanaerobacterium sp. RBIITD]